MALVDDIRTLSGVGLFSGLTEEQLRLLAFGVETVRFRAGREIYREGAEADCGYVVASGTVVLYRDHEGVAVPVMRVSDGAVLGELALLAPTSRLTYAAAETDVELLRIKRAHFRRILEEYPEAAAALHGKMTEDLHALLKRIEAIAPRFAEG